MLPFAKNLILSNIAICPNLILNNVAICPNFILSNVAMCSNFILSNVAICQNLGLSDVAICQYLGLSYVTNYLNFILSNVSISATSTPPRKRLKAPPACTAFYNHASQTLVLISGSGLVPVPNARNTAIRKQKYQKYWSISDSFFMLMLPIFFHPHFFWNIF
jgi:hypothetical protein